MPVTVELWLEIINKPGKICPAWGYLSHEPPLARLVAVLNGAHWPAAAALARRIPEPSAGSPPPRCWTAWLLPVTIPLAGRYCGRSASWSSAPAGNGIRPGSGAPYLLKDHPLLAPIDTLPILQAVAAWPSSVSAQPSSIPRPLRLTSKSSRARNQLPTLHEPDHQTVPASQGRH